MVQSTKCVNCKAIIPKENVEDGVCNCEAYGHLALCPVDPTYDVVCKFLDEDITKTMGLSKAIFSKAGTPREVLLNTFKVSIYDNVIIDMEKTE